MTKKTCQDHHHPTLVSTLRNYDFFATLLAQMLSVQEVAKLARLCRALGASDDTFRMSAPVVWHDEHLPVTRRLRDLHRVRALTVSRLSTSWSLPLFTHLQRLTVHGRCMCDAVLTTCATMTRVRELCIATSTGKYDGKGLVPSPKALRSLGRPSCTVRTLHLKPSRISPTVLRACQLRAVASIARLESLHVSLAYRHVSHVQDEALMHVCDGCRELTHLVCPATGCARVLRKIGELPRLVKLELRIPSWRGVRELRNPQLRVLKFHGPMVSAGTAACPVQVTHLSYHDNGVALAHILSAPHHIQRLDITYVYGRLTSDRSRLEAAGFDVRDVDTRGIMCVRRDRDSVDDDDSQSPWVHICVGRRVNSYGCAHAQVSLRMEPGQPARVEEALLAPVYTHLRTHHHIERPFGSGGDDAERLRTVFLHDLVRECTALGAADPVQKHVLPGGLGHEQWIRRVRLVAAS